MAARQALIVILIIISPLAFVCYLLPGTEKWFKKWRDLFLTMLVFFPAFAVIFGGAQLAGIIIIQNATGANGGIMQILGMVVQVIPLALTPIILKLSGGVLGKFAGFVNDKNKGLYDRSKNWSKDRRETIKNKKLANPNMARFNPNRLRRWQIITVDYVKKIWKPHRKMPRIHLEIQPGIRSLTCMPDRLPGDQISYLRKMIIATSNLRWVMHQMIYTIKDLYTIVP